MYRRWNAERGGVYGLVSENTPPNPYLSDLPERDITTPSGKELTLINPAYMTRLVHEFSKIESGVLGHITSLNPIRPQNAPDDWERKALEVFEEGAVEVNSIEFLNGTEYMRFMGPLKTEQACLKCHSAQGYKLGDIRGGISVSVPMEPLNLVANRHVMQLSLGHFAIWLMGLFGVYLASRKLNLNTLAQNEVEKEKELLIDDLQDALSKIRTLDGLIPICAHCKKIRDDKGFWKQVEAYIEDHSRAEFSHGICPDCMKKYYEDYV